MSLGTEGRGSERYALYFPFSISPGRNISDVIEGKSYSIDGHEIRIEKLVNYWAISIGSFSTEEIARNYYSKIKSSILWVSLKFGVGLSIPNDLTSVVFLDSPQSKPDKGVIRDLMELRDWSETDGYYDADKCVVRPEHKRLIRYENGKGSVVLGISSDNFVNGLKEALSFPSPEKILNNPKLQLGIEVYSSLFFEQSDEARFLKLVTVLEAITPDYDSSEECIGKVNSFKVAIKNYRNELDKKSIEWEEMNSLLSRVGHLKHRSIGSSIKLFLNDALTKLPEVKNREEVIEKVRNLYGVRSVLLHQGKMDSSEIKDGVQFLSGFIPKLLISMYKNESVQ